MANVSWTNPGISGDWNTIPLPTNWTGLIGESYPGQVAAAADMVTIGSSNSEYIVTLNVPNVSIASLTIVGGNGTPHATILRMTAGVTLNIQGGVTLFKKDSNASVDGAGTISFGGQITVTGSGSTPSAGTVTAGTDTTGGILDLTGTGLVSAPVVFAIGTAVSSTLEFDMAGGVSTTSAITINNVNQTLEIGPSGSTLLGAAQNVTNGTILMAGGDLTDLSGISFGSGSSNGSLSGFGVVIADQFTRSGNGTANTITAIDGKLTLFTTIGNNSGLVFNIGNSAASSLQLDFAPGTGNTFTFLGPVGNLALEGFETYDVGVSHLNVGTSTPTNFIDILGAPGVTVASGQIGIGTTGTVTLSNGDTFSLTGITNGSGGWHVLTTSDGAGGTDVFLSTLCYAAGTRILTTTGERTVESLLQGDIVLILSDGELKAQQVKWLGHRRIDLTAHPRPDTAAPIRIERDAIAPGMPHRDLLVSPDHAIFVDGKLICARQLVNGTTIRSEFGWTAVDYYHVELDQHAILMAEGLPAESYIDTGNSGFFDNSGAPMVLHPDLTDETGYPTREAGSCAPFVSDEASVRPVWQQLADRAAAIGRPVPQRATTTDHALRLRSKRTGRRTYEPVYSDSNLVIFMVPSRSPEVRLLSRAQSPTEARPWLDDRRHLGVRVKRIVLRGADELREIPLDHPDLSQGWWAVERDGQAMSRWTDGEAVLPLPEMSGTVMLEVHLAGSMTYVVEATPEDETERRAVA